VPHDRARDGATLGLVRAVPPRPDDPRPAPGVMSNPRIGRPDLRAELEQRFRRPDPVVPYVETVADLRRIGREQFREPLRVRPRASLLPPPAGVSPAIAAELQVSRPAREKLAHAAPFPPGPDRGLGQDGDAATHRGDARAVRAAREEG